MNLSSDIFLALLSFVVAIIGWLLRQKDAAQAEEIKNLKATAKLLFEKHDEDVKALQELRIQIAEGHYKKVELDVKFDRMESTFKLGFESLGTKLDIMSKALMEHMIAEKERK